MQERAGWHLPADDSYFARFVEGPPPKRNGFYREHLQAALGFVTAWNCAIDVGGHVGFWTFDLAQRFKVVHAFEPVPSTFQCLLKNVAEFENVNCHNFAVGNGPGRCAIQNDKQRPGNSGSNYIMPGAGDVPMVSLDDMARDGAFPYCDFLKVDVEGFELRVLEGARELITRCWPVISMECTDFKFRTRYGIPEGQAERWLVKRGYRVVWAQRPDKVFVAV